MVFLGYKGTGNGPGPAHKNFPRGLTSGGTIWYYEERKGVITIPKAIEAAELVESRRGRPEGDLSKEVRACLAMLASGDADAVEVEAKGATREQVATKVSRISKELGVKVSTYSTKSGGVGLRLRTTDAKASK